MAQQSWPFYDDRSPRWYFADAEDLAGKGGAEFLEKIKPFLEKQGVQVKSIEEYFEEEYRITVNGKETVIWSQEEEKEERARKPGLTWGLSTVRIFTIVNELLEQAGSEERVYTVCGGNDLEAFFLTSELADFICGSLQVGIEDQPYIPVAEYHWFDQPNSPGLEVI